MRVPKKEKVIKVDILKPFAMPTTLQNDICFGKQWCPKCRECRICASQNECGIVFKETVQKHELAKADSYKANKHFDLTPDAERIIVSNIKKFGVVTDVSNYSPLTHDEVTEWFKGQLKTEDSLMVNNNIEALLDRNPNVKFDQTNQIFTWVNNN